MEIRLIDKNNNVSFVPIPVELQQRENVELNSSETSTGEPDQNYDSLIDSDQLEDQSLREKDQITYAPSLRLSSEEEIIEFNAEVDSEREHYKKQLEDNEERDL